MTRDPAPPAAALERSLLALLRRARPAEDFDADSVDAALRLYECGGYLHHLWSRNGTSTPLPPGWAGGLARSHRKTTVDNLAALAGLRRVGRLLLERQVPFLLLKGGAYLIDLYDDPGMRMLTDVDLLIRRADVDRVARLLWKAGMRGDARSYEPERFEMWFPGEGHCRFEFHAALGQPGRYRICEQEIWARSIASEIEGVASRRLGPEDAVLYHAAHLADHYFGPSLKWAIDLREMLRRWTPDPAWLVARAREWRVRTALHLALRHVDKIFPGEVPEGLADRLAPGPLRRRLLRPYLSDAPLEIVNASRSKDARRGVLRILLVDRPIDAAGLLARVVLRPLEMPLRRALGLARPPWDGPGVGRN